MQENPYKQQAALELQYRMEQHNGSLEHTVSTQTGSNLDLMLLCCRIQAI